MKKSLILGATLAIAASLMLGFAAFATGTGTQAGKADKRGGPRLGISKLTEAQKTELSSLMKAEAAKVKAELSKLVSAGVITKVMADSAGTCLDKRVSKIGEGCCPLFFGGGVPRIDESVMTTAQKSAYQSYKSAVKAAGLAFVEKLYSLKVITAEEKKRLAKAVENGPHKRGRGIKREKTKADG